MTEGLYSVDRFEDGLAVLVDETGNSHPVELQRLPDDLCQGDMVRYANGVFAVDASAAQKRKQYALSLLQKLRKGKS